MTLLGSQMYSVLNLGGEGEVAGALNVNSMIATRRNESSVKSHPLVMGDIQQLPFKDDAFEAVVGNDVPFQHGEFPEAVAREAYRVLKSGGRIRIVSRSGGATGWLGYLERAGFHSVGIEGGYAVGAK